MTEIYHRTFTPWTASGCAMVLSSGEHWEEPEKWDFNASLDFACHRVRIIPDVFDCFDGPIVDCEKELILRVEPGCKGSMVTLSDIRHRLFSLIDNTPNLDWMIETQHPEDVRRMWPKMNNQGNNWLLQNVMLGVRVTTQGEADTLIPELLKLRDLASVLYVVVDPREAIELWDYVTPKVCDCNYNGCECYPGESMIDLLILRGTADPLHPEWVWNIRDQCSAGGVQLDGQEGQEAIAGTPSNSRLRELAANNPPPDEWFGGEEDKPWTKR